MREKKEDRPIDAARAGDIGLKALEFLAADGERLGRFLALTGLSPATIRSAAGEPRFLPAILEYLAADEPLLEAFAAESRLDPALVGRARQALSPDFPAEGA